MDDFFAGFGDDAPSTGTDSGGSSNSSFGDFPEMDSKTTNVTYETVEDDYVPEVLNNNKKLLIAATVIGLLGLLGSYVSGIISYYAGSTAYLATTVSLIGLIEVVFFNLIVVSLIGSATIEPLMKAIISLTFFSYIAQYVSSIFDMFWISLIIDLVLFGLVMKNFVTLYRNTGKQSQKDAKRIVETNSFTLVTADGEPIMSPYTGNDNIGVSVNGMKQLIRERKNNR